MMCTRGLQDIRVERSLTLKLYYGCHTYTPLKSLRKTYVFLVQFPTHQRYVDVVAYLGKFTEFAYCLVAIRLIKAHISQQQQIFNSGFIGTQVKIFCIYIHTKW